MFPIDPGPTGGMPADPKAVDRDMHLGAVVKVAVLLAALAAATALGLVMRRSSGRPRSQPADKPALDAALLAGLGVPAGEVTLLQFSSAFCAPCRATRRILEQVAGTVAGVHHIDVDAESHLSEVRSLGILRTPTTLVLDTAGRVRNRVVGQPRRDDVLTVLAPLIGTAVPTSGKTQESR
ncbi:MAG: thioredoxin family protein [Pseudonocardiales bacterium]